MNTSRGEGNCKFPAIASSEAIMSKSTGVTIRLDQLKAQLGLSSKLAELEKSQLGLECIMLGSELGSGSALYSFFFD